MIEEYSKLIMNILIAALGILNISFWLRKKYLIAIGGLIGFLLAFVAITYLPPPNISAFQTLCSSETTASLCMLLTNTVVLIVFVLIGHALGWIAEEIKARKINK